MLLLLLHPPLHPLPPPQLPPLRPLLPPPPPPLRPLPGVAAAATLLFLSPPTHLPPFLFPPQEADSEKQAVVQRILGLGDAEAENLRRIVAEGGFKVAAEEAEEAAFF